MGQIEVTGLTKDYGKGRGIFDVSFSVEQGQTFGYIGPNGAGKSTTIRHLLGFVTPDKGTCTMLGKDCFKDAESLHQQIGYLPGEIVLNEEMTGKEYLRFMGKLKNLTDETRKEELWQRLQLKEDQKIRKMSKGTKQKIAIINAFMGNPAILILDEPTSGLDPLMQRVFVDLILEEKKKGTTILMSSHSFEEMERTCDALAILREGKIVAIRDQGELRREQVRSIHVTFATEADTDAFASRYKAIHKIGPLEVHYYTQGNMDKMIKLLAQYQVQEMRIEIPSIEEAFLKYYGGETDA